MTGNPDARTSLPTGLLEALLEEAVHAVDGVESFAAACERLVQAGLPVDRASIGVRVLDPSTRAVNLVWRRNQGAREALTIHSPDVEAQFRRTPIGVLFEAGKASGHWHLPDPEAAQAMPMLGELAQEGLAGHAVWLVRLAGSAGAIPGVAVSFATRRPGSFDPAELARLGDVANLMGLAAIRHTLDSVLATLMGCYLGPRAGLRVLAGDVHRGEAQAIEAAVLLTDLRGFTAWCEGRAPRDVVRRLDRHFEAMGGGIEAAGGEILKFVGDGLIAIFPVTTGDGRDACAAALAGAHASIEATQRLNAVFAAEGEGPLPLDVALSYGQVMWGNVGTRDRLDFTVIGQAVNEAARIESLCDALGLDLLLSDEVARRIDGPLQPMGTHSLHGFATPRTVWAPLQRAG